MKIEKLNENQIRCTLSHNDLASRELIDPPAKNAPATYALLQHSKLNNSFLSGSFSARSKLI